MKREYWVAILPYYLLVGILAICAAGMSSRVVSVLGDSTSSSRMNIFVIDAGHGYPDGGAMSFNGVLEAEINLQIAQRLNDLFHFLGYETVMIRESDESVYTEGESIGAKKVSDLKKRVQIVNQTENAVLLSIHQNTFPDSRYGGPQVIYAANQRSKELASILQKCLKNALDPASKRSAKEGRGIYLLENINSTGVLIECGFISNPEDEAKLLTNTYQQQLCCVIATAVVNYLVT